MMIIPSVLTATTVVFPQNTAKTVQVLRNVLPEFVNADRINSPGLRQAWC